MIQRLLRTMLPAENDDGLRNHDDSGEITELLRKWSSEEPAVRSELIVLLYPELRRIAEARMRSERRDHTLQPTALVNEFFLRLARQEKLRWRNREHFLAVASRAMLNLLIDYARSHNAPSNGGDVFKVQLDGLDVQGYESGIDPVLIGDLLDRLASQEPRMAKVVEMHCFGGLTFDEIALILKVDSKTAKRDWQMARAWLRGKLRKRKAYAG
jgi:RNA polymerase sigma-70 factor, ECF subfamily